VTRTGKLLLAVALAACSAPAAAGPAKDQPPEVKLKLGHYANTKRGIGLVVDLTHHEARVKYDGTKKIQKLDPVNHSRDSTSYGPTINQVTLVVYDSGRIEVWVAGSENMIPVERDGDADPL
jgi:hypothetical protein